MTETYDIPNENDPVLVAPRGIEFAYERSSRGDDLFVVVR